MTKKQDLQKEILAKVKPGMKPSDLKKLKRSKSADDIKETNFPTSPFSNNVEQLQEGVKKQTDLNSLLSEQLTEKQQELESLREQLEITNQKLTESNAELDNSLEVRYKNLQDWKKLQEIIKKLNEELEETIDQASDEIVAGDDEISKLKQKIYQLKSAKEQCERDLKSERIKRGTHPKPTNSTNKSLPISFYALLALGILFLATNITVSIPAEEK